MHKTKGKGIAAPEILIPSEKVNMNKWAVVACDQFTADPDYWDRVERYVGGAPSTLHMTLPEIYLNDDDADKRIEFARQSMGRFLNDGILQALPPGFILVERRIGGAVRRGLMAAVDLEEFHFDPSERTLIRSSEQTLLDRIPPRLAIRTGAMIELPHILVMIDDPGDTVIGALAEKRSAMRKLYDFELMMDGGRIAGYYAGTQELIEQTIDALDALPTQGGMRYCVGDGNHSLVTAKFAWDNAKAELPPEELEDHPLRYALVELVNVRDPNVTFLPIHRILYKVNATHCVQFIADKLNQGSRRAKLVYSSRRKNITQNTDPNIIPFISKSGAGRFEVSGAEGFAAEYIQPIIEEYAAANKSCRVEYVHTTGECLSAADEYDTLSLLLTSPPKEALFPYVAEHGLLPKKSFSLGEAEEKRYYLECRMIGRRSAEDDEDVQWESAEEQTEDRPELTAFDD